MVAGRKSTGGRSRMTRKSLLGRTGLSALAASGVMTLVTMVGPVVAGIGGRRAGPRPAKASSG